MPASLDAWCARWPAVIAGAASSADHGGAGPRGRRPRANQNV